MERYSSHSYLIFVSYECNRTKFYLKKYSNGYTNSCTASTSILAGISHNLPIKAINLTIIALIDRAIRQDGVTW